LIWKEISVLVPDRPDLALFSFVPTMKGYQNNDQEIFQVIVADLLRICAGGLGRLWLPLRHQGPFAAPTKVISGSEAP
jgi:hypothetical protein